MWHAGVASISCPPCIAGAQQVANQNNSESAYRNSWQYAAEMTRKAEMEAQLAELKSQEAYKWCVANLGVARLLQVVLQGLVIAVAEQESLLASHIVSGLSEVFDLRVLGEGHAACD